MKPSGKQILYKERLLDFNEAIEILMEEENRLSNHASGHKTGSTDLVSKKFVPGKGE